MTTTAIFENTRDIYMRISRAAMKAGRSPDEILLVAVTKTVGEDAIRDAVDSGIRVFGENRVQETRKKMSARGLMEMTERLEWHLIGHLQKNKAKDAVRLFDLIHSLDSADLAAELDRQAEKTGKVQRVLIQVKLSEEESKHGIDPAGLVPLLRAIAQMKSLRAEGLMTIPPYFSDVRDVVPYFRRLRELRDKTVREGFVLPELSMGMSHDFEAAIEEGATMVRIGTAIFGERR